MLNIRVPPEILLLSLEAGEHHTLGPIGQSNPLVEQMGKLRPKEVQRIA
jgi:hypothetical protein